MSQLDSVSKAFDPERLRLARQLKKYTKSRLADEVEVTSSAMSQYEKGTTRPSPVTVRRLAWVLEVSPEFFMSNRPVPHVSDAHFRSLRSTSKADRAQAIAASYLLYELVGVFEEHLRLPAVDVPRQPIDDDATRAEIEHIAAAVRTEWNLEPGPIGNVVRLLEQHGVIVSRLPFGNRKLDAFSIEFGERPFVVLGEDKGDAARSRLDAAHELGHLVMHDEVEPGDGIVERQAHQFAAAFLMPEPQIRSALPSKFDLRELIRLKQQWGVSIGALLYRSRELEVMTDATYRRAVTFMSSRGYRTKEPASIGRPEVPSLLLKCWSALEDAGWTFDDISNATHVPTDRLTQFFNGLDPRAQIDP